MIPALAAAFAPAHQRYLLEARQMQALSFMVHIPLVCFGISFPVMVMFAEVRWLRTGDPVYRELARRWSRVMIGLFGVGVITGTILSFEMGLLWPNFTATFGGVFGLGFAIEGFSFFVEAIFIGIYVYGWNRLSPRTHLLAALPIVFTGFTGSLMVISVNAWMQHPGGFTLRGGHVVKANPWSALLGNDYLWHELIHMYIAGYMVSGFILAGVYAFARLRGRWGRYERAGMAIPLTIAVLASIAQAPVGDWAARDVATNQPIKLAAMEGLSKTTRGASEHLLGWFVNGKVKFGIPIPHLLSLLAFHSWNAAVQGLDTVAPSQRPPVNIVRADFQIMVGIGTLLVALSLFTLAVRLRKRRLPESPWFYRALLLAGPLATVALIAGWIVTEVGRQPWVVYHVMLSSDAVTGAPGIPVGYGALIAVYIAVAIGLAWMLRRLAARPLELEPEYRCSPLLSAVPMAFVLGGVVLYAVLAGADFGAGIWTLLSGPGEHGAEVRDSAHHSMGPLWEANHVWLIFVLTVFWTAYPTAFGSIASTLAVPMFIAGLGIVTRGAAYALRSGAAGPREHVLIDGLFAVSSILAPFALGTMVGAIATGSVPVGNAAGAHFGSWLGTTQVLDGAIAVVTSAYLAAVYLAADCTRRGEPQLARDFRLRALAAGPLAGGLAVAGIVALHHSAHPLYHQLLEGRALPAVLVSAIAGVIALGLVQRRRFEPARYVAALAIAAVLAGWALAQWPRVLPGLDVRQAAASHDMLVAVIVAVLGGGAIVFPSLAWLFRLSLRGSFDPVTETKQVPSGAPAVRNTGERTAAAGRVAVATLIIGVGLLVFADAPALHAIGVAALIVFVIAGFLWLVPALLPDTPAGG